MRPSTIWGKQQGVGASDAASSWQAVIASSRVEGLRLAEMAYLSEGQIPEEVGHGAVL